MIGASAKINDAGSRMAAEKLRLRVEQAMLNATDKVVRAALKDVRAGLPGRLKGAIGMFSDKQKGMVYRRGTYSAASAGIAIRSKSERTVGAIKSYTEGASIVPVRGRWLWIATDQIQRIVGKGKGRRRVTPALYRTMGLESKVGPLKLVKPAGRPPLLVVQTVSVMPGKNRSARAMPRNGRPRGGRVEVGIVAFYAIPFTRREKTVDVPQTMMQHASRTNSLIADELRKSA